MADLPLTYGDVFLVLGMITVAALLVIWLTQE